MTALEDFSSASMERAFRQPSQAPRCSSTSSSSPEASVRSRYLFIWWALRCSGIGRYLSSPFEGATPAAILVGPASFFRNSRIGQRFGQVRPGYHPQINDLLGAIQLHNLGDEPVFERQEIPDHGKPEPHVR